MTTTTRPGGPLQQREFRIALTQNGRPFAVITIEKAIRFNWYVGATQSGERFQVCTLPEFAATTDNGTQSELWYAIRKR